MYCTVFGDLTQNSQLLVTRHRAHWLNKHHTTEPKSSWNDWCAFWAVWFWWPEPVLVGLWFRQQVMKHVVWFPAVYWNTAGTGVSFSPAAWWCSRQQGLLVRASWEDGSTWTPLDGLDAARQVCSATTDRRTQRLVWSLTDISSAGLVGGHLIF